MLKKLFLITWFLILSVGFSQAEVFGPTQAAEDIDIDDAGAYYTGTQVEVALQEIGAGSVPSGIFLKLNQSTPQDISGGQPDFLAGLRAGSTNQLSIDVSGNINLIPTSNPQIYATNAAVTLADYSSSGITFNAGTIYQLGSSLSDIDLQITAVTPKNNNTMYPFIFQSYFGGTAPTVPAVIIQGWKWNGTTFRVGLANTEKTLAIWNGGSEKVAVYGNGDITTTGTIFGNIGKFTTGINDVSDVLSIDPNNRQLYYSDGTTVIIDWGGGTIYDNAGVNAFSWFGGRSIYDVAGVSSIDAENRILQDTTGVNGVDYANRRLIYEDGSTIAMDWTTANAYIYDTAGAIALTFGRNLIDSTGFVTALDWSARQLWDSAGNIAFDWSAVGTINAQDTNIVTTGELTLNDHTIKDDNPKVTLWDTDSNVKYTWHNDSADPNWVNLTLWREDVNGVNPDKPLMRFDNNNDLFFDNGADISTAGDIVIDSDTSRFKIGDGQDLYMYHDGTNSYIQSDTGQLRIGGTGGTNFIKFDHDIGGTGVGGIAFGNSGNAFPQAFATINSYRQEGIVTGSTAISATLAAVIPASTALDYLYGLTFTAQTSTGAGAGSTLASLYGVHGNTIHIATSPTAVTQIMGGYFAAQQRNTTDAVNVMGCYAYPQIYNGATGTSVYGFLAGSYLQSSTAVAGSWYDFYGSTAPNNSGTVTNKYGLYIQSNLTTTTTITAGVWINNLTSAGTAYGIVVDSDAIGLNLGAAQDGSLIHNGSGMILQSDAVTAGDYLQLRGGTNGIDFNIGANEEMTLTANLLTFTAATDIAFATTTGTKIGTATNQLLGFYDATPVDQPATVNDAATQDLTGLNTVDQTKLEADLTSCKNAINSIIDRLQELGLIA